MRGWIVGLIVGAVGGLAVGVFGLGQSGSDEVADTATDTIDTGPSGAAVKLKMASAFGSQWPIDRPVVMGCSMGGRIALHLARAHADEFRAVIGLEAADQQTPWYDTEWLHRPDVHGGEVCAALISGLIAPHSPSEARWETLWGYLQSGPGVFKGDLHFYREDSDYRGRVEDIDTDRCPVFCSPANMISPASLAIPCAPPQRSRARKR